MKNFLIIISFTLFYSLPIIETNAQSREIAVDINSFIGEEWRVGAALNYYIQTGSNTYFGAKLSYYEEKTSYLGSFYSFYAPHRTLGFSFVRNHQFKHGKRRRLSLEYGLAMAYHMITYHVFDDGTIGIRPRSGRTDLLAVGVTSGVKYDWRLFKKFHLGIVLKEELLYRLNKKDFEYYIQPSLGISYRW